MKPANLPPPKYAMDGDGKYWEGKYSDAKTFIVEYKIPGLLTIVPITRNIKAENEAGAMAIFNATKAEDEIFVSIYSETTK